MLTLLPTVTMLMLLPMVTMQPETKGFHRKELTISCCSPDSEPEETSFDWTLTLLWISKLGLLPSLVNSDTISREEILKTQIILSSFSHSIDHLKEGCHEFKAIFNSRHVLLALYRLLDGVRLAHLVGGRESDKDFSLEIGQKSF